MTDVELYVGEYDRFRKSTVFSSGLSLLLAAASRLPTWEVSSPVGSLVGSVNVSFLPVFGPIFVFGTFTYTYLSLLDLARLRGALPEASSSEFARAILKTPWIHFRRGPGTLAQRAARLAARIWCLLVPLLAYLILLASFFNFVRPKGPDSDTPRYASRAAQIGDLLVGSGGWTGFRPLSPSIQDNLKAAADGADDKEKGRLRRLANSLPWIYPPWQTWAYLIALALLATMAVSAGRILARPDGDIRNARAS